MYLAGQGEDYCVKLNIIELAVSQDCACWLGKEILGYV